MNKVSQDAKSDILLGVFVAALLVANILGGKITEILHVPVSVGIFFFPLTFLITDIVEEVRGKKEASRFIRVGLTALVFTLGAILLSRVLPSAARSVDPAAFNLIFKSSARIIFASLVAFFLGQTHDIWALDLITKKTAGRFLWLRNNLATIVSQFIDTVIFMYLAFYQLTPKFTFGYVFALIVPYFIFKVAFALLDTPFVYLGVSWFRASQPNSQVPVSKP